MNEITLSPYNELYYKLVCSSQTLAQLKKYFSFKAPGFFFNPLYKNGLWNGYICLIKGDLFPIGLFQDLCLFAKNNNVKVYQVKDEASSDISEEHLDEVLQKTPLSDINKKTGDVFQIKLRNYQEDAIRTCILNKHQLIVSQTSTGKSLMIYMILK